MPTAAPAVVVEYKLGECRKCHKPCERRASWCRVCLNKAKSKITRQKLANKKKYQESGKAAVRQAQLESGRVLAPDSPIYYDKYKEPLKSVEGGFGYHGVVATNEEKTHIQCHLCGHLFMHLPTHIRAAHKINAREYKEKFGLGMTTALIGEHLRDNLIKVKETAYVGQEGLMPGLKTYWQEVKAGTRPDPNKGRKGNNWSLEKQNEMGLCPDQVLEKLTDLYKEIGHVPSYDEFRDHYHYRYISSMKYHFGNWREFLKQAQLTGKVEQLAEATTPEKLIGYLQDFHEEHGRVPMNSDFKRGIVVARYHYFKHFGTLNHARIAANLPAVIPVPGHRYILVPPEKFSAYEELKDTMPSKRERTKTGALSKVLGEGE